MDRNESGLPPGVRGVFAGRVLVCADPLRHIALHLRKAIRILSIMSEIKFSCPSCGQNLEIAAGFGGRQVDCPACKKPLLVPKSLETTGAAPTPTSQASAAASGALESPKLEESSPSPATPFGSTPSSEPKPEPKFELKPEATPELKLKVALPKPGAESASPRSVDAPSKPAADAPPESGSPAPASEPDPVTKPRLAVLTPGVKLEIVRSIRSRLSDEEKWIPGKLETGKYRYAARREGEKSVPVEPTDPTATHLSLFGAVLLEFEERNVYKVSPDRRKFLDEEMSAAIQEVLGRSADGVAVTEAEREALTHPQCMAVLANLEKRYEQDDKAAVKADTESKIKRIRVADLVKKMELGAPVIAEEVASALYYELDALQQRIDRLEASSKPRP